MAEAQVFREFELQNLSPVEREDIKIKRQIARTLKDLFPEVPCVEDALENTIVEKSDTLLHHNMMHYLTLAYANHFSVVISPDVIFYTVLCELADAIKAKPDTFRFLFTNSGEKAALVTQTHDPAYLDLDQVIAGISSSIAADASVFTADFSCSTFESRLAIKAAFCDAMSPYFDYMNTRCGIPRIRVLGSEQDWISLETKVYRMATEIFNQAGDQDLTNYLFGAQRTIRQMRTETDPNFWIKFFAIDNCRSGHTDLVVGWSTTFFRKGATDFYKYESHISSVGWTNLETGNEYQLRTGLLYSVINEGESDLDKQFPWLEPQFAHIVIDKNRKMTPEQYKEYINTVLKRDDHAIFLGFFDVLKDESLVIKKTPAPQIQRLEIVGKQFDYWTAHPDQPVDLDFSVKKFDAALNSYADHGQFKELIDQTFEKLKKTFDTCQIRRLVLPDFRSSMLYNKCAEMLQILTGKSFLEELDIKNDTEETFEALLNLLSDPNCQLKSLSISHHNFNAKDSAKLSGKLLQMKIPLKKITISKISEMKLADAIFTLATQGSLTAISIMSSQGDDKSLGRIIQALAQAKNLEHVDLPNLASPELAEELASAWKGNTTLTSVQLHEWISDKKLLDLALTLPSLRNLSIVARDDKSSDMEFLQTTTKLQKLEISVEVTLAAATSIAKFLALDTCQLEALIIRSSMYHTKLTPEVVKALSKGLATNHSLKIFKCELMSDTDGPEELTASLAAQKGLEEVKIKNFCVKPEAQENIIRLIETSTTLKKLHYNSKQYNEEEPHWPQVARLVAAIEKNATLEVSLSVKK